jgi:hypothetical protein
VSEGGGDGEEEWGSREDSKGMVEVGLWTTDLTNGHEWLLGREGLGGELEIVNSK